MLLSTTPWTLRARHPFLHTKAGSCWAGPLLELKVPSTTPTTPVILHFWKNASFRASASPLVSGNLNLFYRYICVDVNTWTWSTIIACCLRRKVGRVFPTKHSPNNELNSIKMTGTPVTNVWILHFGADTIT